MALVSRDEKIVTLLQLVEGKVFLRLLCRATVFTIRHLSKICIYKNIKPSYHSGLPHDQTTGEIETDQAINGR